MSILKLYTFLDARGEVLEQVRAEDHDHATVLASDNRVDGLTDFYSEDLKDEVQESDDLGYTPVDNNLGINIAPHYCVNCECACDEVDFEGKCKECAW